MGDLTELFEVDSKQALMFFFGRLNDEVVSREISQPEVLYVASVLAHYAQTSRCEASYMSPSGNLYDVLDTFVLPGFTAEGSAALEDPEILEIAGSHTLLLVGFFRDQMKRTHSLGWYDHLGRSFFTRASCHSKERKKADLLERVAEHFPVWAITCRNMSRTFHDERFLLKLES